MWERSFRGTFSREQTFLHACEPARRDRGHERASRTLPQRGGQTQGVGAESRHQGSICLLRKRNAPGVRRDLEPTRANRGGRRSGPQPASPGTSQVYEKCLVSQTQANDLLDQLLKINTDFAAGVVRDGLQAASQATFRASRRMSRRPTRWPERPTRWLKRGAKRPLPAGWYRGRQWRPTASPLRLFHSRASLLFAWIFVAGS